MDKVELSVSEQVKKRQNQNISCRICKGDHWTPKCPYKDTLQPLDELLDSKNAPATAAPPAAPSPATSGKYVPPSRARAQGPNASSSVAPSSRRRDEDANIVRVANLSQDTTEQDIQRMFQKFGPVSRVYLAKDRDSGLCKGFAFINYISRSSGEQAIKEMNGFGFDNLILQVDWSEQK